MVFFDFMRLLFLQIPIGFIHCRFMDQHMISIRIAEWMERNNGDELVYKVPDEGYSRVDRSTWNADILKLNETTLLKRHDAHMPLKPYLPARWKKIMPLINLMYGGRESWQSKWCDGYLKQFYAKVKNFVA